MLGGTGVNMHYQQVNKLSAKQHSFDDYAFKYIFNKASTSNFYVDFNTYSGSSNSKLPWFASSNTCLNKIKVQYSTEVYKHKSPVANLIVQNHLQRIIFPFHNFT